MKPLRASQMPQVRSQIAATYERSRRVLDRAIEMCTADPNADVRGLLGRGASAAKVLAHHEVVAASMRGIKTAAMWWLDRDMTTLAVDTATYGELPELAPDEAIQRGLMWFDGGIEVLWQGRPDRIDALSWTWVEGAFTPMVWHRGKDGSLSTLGPTDPWGDEIAYEVILFRRLVCAALLLAREPTVAEARPATFARDGDPRDKRKKAIPDVTVISVRPRPEPTVGPNGEQITSTRQFSHRWIVRGHMHTVRYGRGKTLSRRQWYAPYVAGPEGKPLVVKDRVWALRQHHAAEKEAS